MIADNLTADKLLYQFTLTQTDELAGLCRNLILEDKLPKKENAYHLVVNYFLLLNDLENAFLYLEKTQAVFGFVRPRTLHLMIQYLAEKTDLENLTKLIQKTYYWESALNETSHLDSLALLLKGNDEDFWKVFQKMKRDIQFVTQHDKLIAIMTSKNFTCVSTDAEISNGTCECGTQLETICYSPPDPKNYHAKIEIPVLPPGKFTIIIDAANVGFYDLSVRQKGKSLEEQKKENNNINWDNITRMDHLLRSVGHTPLFVFNRRHQKRNKTDVISYYAPFGVNDDPYFAYISITLQIPLVSNDDLCDMILEIDPNVITWVAQNRMCYRFERRSINFYYKDIHAKLYQVEPLSYSICIQSNETSCHFPYLTADRVKWMCNNKSSK